MHGIDAGPMKSDMGKWNFVSRKRESLIPGLEQEICIGSKKKLCAKRSINNSRKLERQKHKLSEGRTRQL